MTRPNNQYPQDNRPDLMDDCQIHLRRRHCRKNAQEHLHHQHSYDHIVSHPRYVM
jgi:hypothetical protein